MPNQRATSRFVRCSKPQGSKIPYRLPELLEATNDTVVVTEGEKDADNVAALGFIATTNSGGAGKWTSELNTWLSGRDVHVVIDNDEAGIKHGQVVAESLKSVARSVRVIRLPGLAPKGDLSDWIEAGGTPDELSALFQAAPLYGREPLGFTAAQLAAMRFPPIQYVVPGLIAEGLTILAGKPKRGKSWACLEAAIAVATGGTTLGGIECEQGDVLYAALEDNPRRLQRRMTVLAGAFEDWPARLTFLCDMPRLKEGGIATVRKWIEQAENPRLAIIDTLAKVRDAKGSEQSTYEADYAAVSELKALADEKGVAIVLVHHVRKMEAEDPIDTVSGTTGLTGAVDTILVLASTSQGTTLYGRGRDIEEIEKAIRFNKETCRWSIEGDASEVRRTDERGTILAALLDADGPLSPSDLSAATGMPSLNVRQLLFKMTKADEIQKCGRGRYRHLDRSDLDNVSTPHNNGNKITNMADYRRDRDGDDHED